MALHALHKCSIKMLILEASAQSYGLIQSARGFIGLADSLSHRVCTPARCALF
jgi:hypothetical protein